MGLASAGVFASEVGEIGDQFVDTGRRRQRIEHVDHPHACAGDDRPPAADFGIDDDALARRGWMLGPHGGVKPRLRATPPPAFGRSPSPFRGGAGFTPPPRVPAPAAARGSGR